MTVPQPQPLDDVPHDVLDAVVAASPLSEEEMAAHPAIPQIIAATYRAARARVAELEAENARLCGMIDAAHGIICNAHQKRVDDVTTADGASPGWAEAARRWIDAYPPAALDAAPAGTTAEEEA